MAPKTKIVVLKARELIYTGIFIIMGIALILLLVYMFAPQKNKKRNETSQSTGYKDGTYSSPLHLGDKELKLTVTVKNGKPKSIALKHLSQSVQTMFPLVEPSVEEINKQLPKISSIDDLKVTGESKYTNTMLIQSMKNALKSSKNN
ncbi:MAG: hypothetical protein PHD70_03460 [Anaerostipes sp.]|jgi:uncharacterized protein with FMN-binding domain|nr:hypothetical protein [Anaerostipes sp.]MDD3745518.1 hypothetical protein [Anaerostipes sp.]